MMEATPDMASAYGRELEFGITVTGEAVKLIESMRTHAAVAVRKDRGDMATDADLAAEALILGAIDDSFPGDGAYSEEKGAVRPDARRRWVIDPLDGTKEYARGLDDFHVLVALEEAGRTVVGVIRGRNGEELYTATADGPAYYGNRQISVSSINDLSLAYVGFHIPTYASPPGLIDASADLMKLLIRDSYRVRPGWSTARQCGWVARGILDAHIIAPSVNKWHDVVEGLMLVERAGGKVTDFRGEPIVADNMENGFVISNGYLHETLLSVVSHVYA